MLLILALAACGDDGTGKNPTDAPPTDGDACPEPSVAPGTGLPPVTELTDGATLQIVHGPQGGWHVDTGGLVVFPTMEVAVSPRLLLDDRQLAGEQQPLFTVLADYDEATCAGTFYEVRAYLDDEIAALPPGTDVLLDYVCTLAGARVTLENEVADLGRETVVTSSVEGTLVLDPYDVPLCAGAR